MGFVDKGLTIAATNTKEVIIAKNVKRQAWKIENPVTNVVNLQVFAKTNDDPTYAKIATLAPGEKIGEDLYSPSGVCRFVHDLYVEAGATIPVTAYEFSN